MLLLSGSSALSADRNLGSGGGWWLPSTSVVQCACRTWLAIVNASLTAAEYVSSTDRKVCANCAARVADGAASDHAITLGTSPRACSAFTAGSREEGHQQGG